MKNIEQLREDLKVFERYAEMNPSLHSHCDDLARKIAALEAAADPWREAKSCIESWRNEKYLSIVSTFFDHLTAENERLTKRVAELENVASDVTALLETTDEASDPSTDTYVAVEVANAALSDMQPPFEGPDDDDSKCREIVRRLAEPDNLSLGEIGAVIRDAAILWAEMKGGA